MLLVSSNLDALVTSFVYMFVYNLSFFIVFWAIQNTIVTGVKTLYSFKDFKLNFFILCALVVTFFSIAGVPPFVGFFSKILILLNLLNSNFFIFFIFFFVLLFFGLYFYVQNVKHFLTGSNEEAAAAFDLTLKTNKNFSLFVVANVFVCVLGFLFFEDLLLYFFWIFL